MKIRKWLLLYLKLNASVAGLSFAIIPSALGSVAAGAAPAKAAVCEVQSAQSNEALADRRLSVQFPDGRTLSVVGHIHGETNTFLKLLRLGDDQHSSNSQYLSFAEETLKELRQTTSDYREEVSFLKKELARENLQFIALENGDFSFPTLNRLSTQLRAYMAEQFGRRGINNNQLRDSAFLTFAGPTRYLMSTEPGLLRRTKVVGIENDPLMEASLVQLTEAQKDLAAVLAQMPAASEAKTALEKSFQFFLMDYQQLEGVKDEEVLESWKPKIPKEHWEKAKKYFLNAIKGSQMLRERDRQAVAKMIQLNGNGIYFVGEAHMNSLADLLEKECRKQAAGGTAERHFESTKRSTVVR